MLWAKGFFMRLFSFLTAAALPVVLVSAVEAAVLPYVVEVPIDSSAVSGPNGDAVLADYRCFELRVTIPQGDQFLVAGIASTLASGSFYSPQGGGDLPVLNATGKLLYDTYVTVPLYNPATPSNPLVGIPGRYTPVPGAAIFPRFGQQASTIDVVWGALGGSGTAGEYTVARFTLSPDANGPISGEIRTRQFVTGSNPITTSFFYNAAVQDGVFRPIVLPEPALGALAPGLGAFFRRSRSLK